MPIAKANVTRISLSLNPAASAPPPRKQTIEVVNRIVAQMLGRAGCDGCGRIAYIDLGFLGDPARMLPSWVVFRWTSGRDKQLLRPPETKSNPWA